MTQLEHIEVIERRLWGAADTMRANSNYASNEYFLPVMGLVFLRHAYSRFLAVKDDIESNLPKRGGKTRALAKADFSQKNAIFLQLKAQFDYLVSLPDSEDRAKCIIEAMDSIEADYDNLRGILPKNEYQELDNDVLGQLLRTLNPDELKKVSGDVFGRIYEYFLTQFADQKAHDGGEFFTPISIVSLIAHVLDPAGGTVLDPACGSGGMFVQSARIVEEHGQSPTDSLTFRGLEKNATTIRLAKMNLAVHGLEGDIKKAITYYEDPHELVGKADFVMANPPFNVDEIDSDKVKTDPRLPFGLPGVNKKEKVSNGNYVWISYFYSYLNEKGKAGFVMSSQASSAGGGEAVVRQKLVETGDVDIMIAIRSNFFYTRAVPCELWFFNRNKPEEYKDKLLMLDARNIYRKVTRKIYDFSPEHQKNLIAIVWLYRGEKQRFLDQVGEYCMRVLESASSYLCSDEENTKSTAPVTSLIDFVVSLQQEIIAFLKKVDLDENQEERAKDLNEGIISYKLNIRDFQKELSNQQAKWKSQTNDNDALKIMVKGLFLLEAMSRSFSTQTEFVVKSSTKLVETCEKEHDAKKSEAWDSRSISRLRRTINGQKQVSVDLLKKIRYFLRQAEWLTKRFPEAELCDVEGLVKLVDRSEIEANGWSLTPGRYVGVTPEEEDEDFDFEQTMRDIHVELDDLNTEAVALAETIKKNFEEMGI